ncbi:ribosomal protein S18-alanine N-acetyltransferase [Streptoalloteichus hindustanus]|uniref:Ribosomal-protein-alanine N-acetyltransferase n=1 Tax=Streptoalloteichus hindustanus TaxID=2017 RepID=A0A1M4TBJ9_STRHI|nr:ribosomal protein S18-alanine N-acetyltransferase [Streptoalloteichus hindustanus]SHE41607.1 ribosomal-protein-alanine N-acetyltransferase [Streptoalloteichus hindustanus]
MTPGGPGESATRLERLRYEDLARCAELERELFPGDDPWRESVFASELDQGHYYLAARVGAELVGYAGLSVVGRRPVAEASVQTIGVDPRWQGRGIGRELLRALLDRADAFDATTFLEVRTDNAPAIGLYTAHGFEVLGLRRRYYQPSGADAYTMRRPPASEADQGRTAS